MQVSPDAQAATQHKSRRASYQRSSAPVISRRQAAGAVLLLSSQELLSESLLYHP